MFWVEYFSQIKQGLNSAKLHLLLTILLVTNFNPAQSTIFENLYYSGKSNDRQLTQTCKPCLLYIYLQYLIKGDISHKTDFYNISLHSRSFECWLCFLPVSSTVKYSVLCVLVHILKDIIQLSAVLLKLFATMLFDGCLSCLF